ncbi:MAG: alpha/beta hydrolase [Actinomycetia bacterium]|nr:alpha/beta hydrolase [Actinomycetes bacterium]MCP4959755.1 alpha/beta hydrolase [Actinomycetes bacterium]
MGGATIEGQHIAWLEQGSGPLAICLHGFPDSAHTFRHQLQALADAGFRAVAPFTRGYAPTGLAPDGLYQAGVRARDVCLLHEALGGDGDAVIIGHDWGAGAANIAAVKEPDRWNKAVLMAVPPGSRVGRAFFDYRQIRRSSYMFFFQHPLSEVVIPHDDYAFIRGLWNDWSPGYDNAADVANFIASVPDAEHLAAALGYYRATLQPHLQSSDYADWDAAGGDVPTQPTLYMHGLDDGCIGVEVADGLENDLSEGSTVHRVPEAGHFLHLEKPDLVNKSIVEFISS